MAGKRRSINVDGIAHGMPIPMGSLVGNILFSSGISGADPSNGKLPEGLEAQCEFAFANMKALVENAGGTVDDIGAVLRSSMGRLRPGAIYNVCDDEAAPPADVIAFACGLLGVEPPPVVPYAEAEKDLSEMARTFWRDNRRVKNRRLKDELGVRLAYPDYRAGLKAIMEGGG